MYCIQRSKNENRNRFRSILLVLWFLCSGFLNGQERIPKNIILFIGDGMGVAHVTAARTVQGTLAMDRFRTLGLITTHPFGRLITDSAAAATAMAAGVKTVNGAVSVTPDKIPVETALEVAEASGMSTGLVATCSVTHATPACFAAHVDDRGENALIAEQMTRSGVDVLLGGGRGHFIPDSVEGSLRPDGKDLLAILRESHTILTTAEEFQNWNGIGPVVGLFHQDHPPPVDKRTLPLTDLTRKAILALSENPKGFFLMVEGSQIDWEAHDNNSDGIIRETIEFDEAIGIGLDFAEENRETLVIVTADHETGGFAVEQGSVELQVVARGDFTTKSHTGTMVPLFAYGPGEEQFGGIRDNTHIGKTLIEFVKSARTP